MQLGHHLLERTQPRVPAHFGGGELGGVRRAEVGAVAAEDRDPLRTCVNVLCHEVRDVGFAAASHPDVAPTPRSCARQ